MDGKLSPLSCRYAVLLVLAQILRSANFTVAAKRSGTLEARGADDFHALLDSISRGSRLDSRPPGPAEDLQDYSGYFSGAFDRIGPGRPQTRGRVRGGRPRHWPSRRRRIYRYGKFNSDTNGCPGIESRGCAAGSDCSGCLGLYTCDISISTCKLKGLSRSTDAFFQSLQDNGSKKAVNDH
ncbi:hypothetical protein GJAV_G00272390 [Gymnothorax javanicus]|nr:hypothetical protein GJAV_G00272390 [Gymnothorax javanicus]